MEDLPDLVKELLPEWLAQDNPVHRPRYTVPECYLRSLQSLQVQIVTFFLWPTTEAWHISLFQIIPHGDRVEMMNEILELVQGRTEDLSQKSFYLSYKRFPEDSMFFGNPDSTSSYQFWYLKFRVKLWSNLEPRWWMINILEIVRSNGGLWIQRKRHFVPIIFLIYSIMYVSWLGSS